MTLNFPTLSIICWHALISVDVQSEKFWQINVRGSLQQLLDTFVEKCACVIFSSSFFFFHSSVRSLRPAGERPACGHRIQSACMTLKGSPCLLTVRIIVKMLTGKGGFCFLKIFWVTAHIHAGQEENRCSVKVTCALLVWWPRWQRTYSYIISTYVHTYPRSHSAVPTGRLSVL